MCRSAVFRVLAVIAISILICAAQANAALVKVDLLGGLGEFEFSADTSWQMITRDGWPNGVCEATPDDSVAAGWYRLTSLGLVPIENTIFSIVPKTGLKGSASQFMGMRGAEGKISLRRNITVRNDQPSELHAGDKLVYRIDRVYMPKFTLPKGTSVQFQLAVNYHTPAPVQERVTKPMPISTQPYGIEVDLEVPCDAHVITLGVEMTVAGNPGAVVPGVYIDGVRLYRKKANGMTYETEQVPVPKTNRSIKTQIYQCDAKQNDTYTIARDFDAVFLKFGSDYPWAQRLKYYNPNIKVGYYALSGAVSDYRDANMVDPIYNNSPMTLSEVAAHNPEWLYRWPAGYVPAVDNRPDRLKDVFFLYDPSYNLHYFVDITNPGYQQAWREIVARKASSFRLDMVFLDGAEALHPGPSSPVQRTPAEVQNFLKAVAPRLRQAGLQCVVNYCVGNLLDGPAVAYFDPNWRTSPAAAADGYVSNTRDNTPDAFFQEWSFFRHWKTNGVDMNQYELGYWLMTLNNMEAINYWSKMSVRGQQRCMYVSVHGVDRFEDPAEGRGGWMHFGLCSYLLEQSEYTMLSFSRVGAQGAYIPIDLTATARLGTPLGKRSILEPDGSLQSKAYKNGLVVVNGHPKLSRTFTLPRKLIDEDGVSLKPKTVITLPPCTGAMFFNK
ncbi:MAG: putative glycoside hydrolase [Armatimonadota bacterium]|jgi:hypothetical protein